MNNKRPHEWVGPHHKDNVLNGALIVAIKVGLLLAFLEGTAPFELPAAATAGVAASASA